jgi:RNA polymerase sigma-32 factor
MRWKGVPKDYRDWMTSTRRREHEDELECSLAEMLPQLGQWAQPFRHHDAVDYEDLFQEALVALLEAMAKFDPARGRLSAYAKPYVLRALNDYVAANQRLIPAATSRGARKALNHVRSFLDAHPNGVDRRAREGFARSIEVSTCDIEEAIAQVRGVEVSASDCVDPLDDDPGSSDGGRRTSSGQELVLALSDRGAQAASMEYAWDTQRRSQLLWGALEDLPQREFRVICERRLREEPTGLRALGELLGVSLERVRQLEIQGIRRLGSNPTVCAAA